MCVFKYLCVWGGVGGCLGGSVELDYTQMDSYFSLTGHLASVTVNDALAADHVREYIYF